MARKIDTSGWTDEEIKQGFAIRRRGGKSVIKISAEDGTVEHLGRTNESHPGKHKLSGTKMWVEDDHEERLKKYKEIQKEANKRYDRGEIDRKERNKLIDDAYDTYIKGKPPKMTDEEINKALDNIKSIGKDDDDFYDPRKEAKYWLEKGEFDKFDKQLKDYGLEEERDEFLGGVNSRIERDYKEYSDKQKYLSIPEKERVQAYVDGKNWKDLVKEKENARNYDIGEKVKYTEDNVSGRVVDKPTKDRITVEWDDGRKNTYSANHPGIEKDEYDKLKGTNKDIKKELTKKQTSKTTKDTSIEDYKKWAKRKGYDDKDSSHIKEYLSVTRKHKK